MPYSDRPTQLKNALTMALEVDTATGNSTTVRPDIIDLVLNESAATDGIGQSQYRPYYTAYQALWSNANFQQLRKASGVEFTLVVPIMTSWLTFQQKIDTKYKASDGWVIPEGFEITEKDLAALDPDCLCGILQRENKNKISPFIAIPTIVSQPLRVP